MIWSEVAKSYMESFERARAERRHYIPPGFIAKALDKYPSELPPLQLDHLQVMTDETGILQHALFTVPNYSHGYTTDDNARALLVSILLDELGNSESINYLPAISPSSGLHLILRINVFEMSWIITTSGQKIQVRTIVMAEQFGH